MSKFNFQLSAKYKFIFYTPFALAVLLLSVKALDENIREFFNLYIPRSYHAESLIGEILTPYGVAFLCLYFIFFMLANMGVDLIGIIKDRTVKAQSQKFIRLIFSSGVLIGIYLYFFHPAYESSGDAARSVASSASLLVFWPSLIAFLGVLYLESRNDQN